MPTLSVDEIPVRFGTGGGPAWTPNVTKAFSGRAAGLPGSAEADPEESSTAPPTAADIEYSGRIKSLDPATRSGVVIVAAKSGGRKIFGLATLDIRFR